MQLSEQFTHYANITPGFHPRMLKILIPQEAT